MSVRPPPVPADIFLYIRAEPARGYPGKVLALAEKILVVNGGGSVVHSTPGAGTFLSLMNSGMKANLNKNKFWSFTCQKPRYEARVVVDFELIFLTWVSLTLT